jgi:hypothetical protein
LVRSTWVAWMKFMLVSCWTLKPLNTRWCLLLRCGAHSMHTCAESSSTSRYRATITSIWIGHWWVNVCHGWPCPRINWSSSRCICWVSL